MSALGSPRPEPRPRSRTLAMTLVGVGMVAAATMLLYEGRDQTVRGDTLEYAARLASQPFAHAVFHSPPDKYLIAVPLLLYHAMFSAFGLAAHLPYRLVVTALVLLCAGLFFLLARRRVGDLLAVPPTLVLLFFGSGWETVMTAMRLPSLIAVASGLGSLLVLERRDRRGDIAAAALLTTSVASHPIGLSFLAAAAAVVIGRPARQRWTAAWLLAIPAAAFGAWWLFLRAPASEGAFPTGPIDVVQFAADSWTSATAHVSGLAGVLGQPSFHQAIAQIVAALLFAVLVTVVAVRRGRAPASFWAALAGLVVLVVATRLSPSGAIRSPEELRYRYPEAVLLLLVLVESVAIARARPWTAFAVAAMLLLGLTYNIDQLTKAGSTARAESQRALGQYSAYEMAGRMLHQAYQPPGFVPSARDYAQAAARYGSVGHSPAVLLAAPPLERAAADETLPGSLGIGVRVVPRRRLIGAVRPGVARVLSGRATRGHGCVRLRPSRARGAVPEVPLNPNPSSRLMLIRASHGLPLRPTQTLSQLAELTVTHGGLRIYAQDISRTAILLGRFASPPAVQLDRPGHGRAGLLRLPATGVTVPWRATVASNQPVTACGLGA